MNTNNVYLLSCFFGFFNCIGLPQKDTDIKYYIYIKPQIKYGKLLCWPANTPTASEECRTVDSTALIDRSTVFKGFKLLVVALWSALTNL